MTINTYITNPENEMETFLVITNTNGEEFKTIVDSNIVSYLQERTWFVKKRNVSTIYDVYSVQGRSKQLYKFVILFNGVKQPTVDEKTYSIDHINRDPLDNRFKNLRWLTQSEQIMNTNKRIRNYNAKMLPDGILPEYLPKFVYYCKEHYGVQKRNTREFFNVRHPSLKTWCTSKSNAVSIQDKLAQAYAYIQSNGFDPFEHPILKFKYTGCTKPSYI